MMRAFVIAALFLSASAPVQGRAARQGSGGVDISRALVQVMRLEGRWVKAVMRRDVKALGRILADDYVGTGSDGEVHNKAQTLAELKSAAVGFKSFKQDGFDVRFDGGTATVTGRATITVLVEDAEVSGRFTYTRVYVRRRGRWQVIQSRTTYVGE
jgi:ketosteroid isomerase-like protein